VSVELRRTDPTHESVLNNLFCRAPALRRWNCGSAVVVKQGSRNEDTTKPQLPEDHPQVVTGAAQHSVHRVAQRSFYSAPFSQFLSSFPSAFMWPMAGSIALRRLIIARSARVMPRRMPG
jgi:hypothetical protein